jgi:hypothetical protein
VDGCAVFPCEDEMALLRAVPIAPAFRVGALPVPVIGQPMRVQVEMPSSVDRIGAVMDLLTSMGVLPPPPDDPRNR